MFGETISLFLKSWVGNHPSGNNTWKQSVRVSSSRMTVADRVDVDVYYSSCFALRSRCFFHLGSGALIVSILSKPRPPSISHSKKEEFIGVAIFFTQGWLQFHSITYQPRIKTQSKKPDRHLVAHMLTHPTHLPYLWGHRGRKNMAETFALKLVGRRGNRILNWSWRFYRCRFHESLLQRNSFFDITRCLSVSSFANAKSSRQRRTLQKGQQTWPLN